MSKKVEKYGTEFVSPKNDIIELRDRITKVIWDMYKRTDILRHPKDRERLTKFLPFLKPTQSKIDHGALPYYSESLRSYINSRTSCMLAFVSRFFIEWMTFPDLKLAEVQELIQVLQKKCDYLESIVELGPKGFVVGGSIAKGFMLMTPEEAADEVYYEECALGKYKRGAEDVI